MIFKFSKHLGKKANKHQISRSEIIKAIIKGRKWFDKRGDKNWHSNYFGIEVAFKKYNGKILIVTIKYPKW